MADNPTVDVLNDLIQVNRDAEAGLRAASENVKNSELDTLFQKYAGQHARFAAELQEEIERLGGTVSGDGAVGGALHRVWLDIKSTLSGNSAGSILASCESAEESAERAYTDAADTNPTGNTRALIEQHRQQIKEFRTRLTRLVTETRDGVEFQKNE